MMVVINFTFDKLNSNEWNFLLNSQAHGLWREKAWNEEEDGLNQQKSPTLDGKLFSKAATRFLS